MVFASNYSCTILHVESNSSIFSEDDELVSENRFWGLKSSVDTMNGKNNTQIIWKGTKEMAESLMLSIGPDDPSRLKWK